MATHLKFYIVLHFARSFQGHPTWPYLERPNMRPNMHIRPKAILKIPLHPWHVWSLISDLNGVCWTIFIAKILFSYFFQSQGRRHHWQKAISNLELQLPFVFSAWCLFSPCREKLSRGDNWFRRWRAHLRPKEIYWGDLFQRRLVRGSKR